MQASIEQEEEKEGGGERSSSGSNRDEVATFPVSVQWVQRMQFIGRDDKNHCIVIDTSPESGGDNSGPSPGRLLLMAVASCTAIDIVSILQKSRQMLTGLQVLSRGLQNSEYPRYYKEIHLKYILRGKALDRSRVERAIRLSEEKYCSVGATVSGKAKIFITYRIEEEKEQPKGAGSEQDDEQ